MRYIIACLIVFLLLAVLRLIEDSPIRSWKAVVITGLTLSFAVCFYLSRAFPPPPPPQVRMAKVNLNRAELVRNIRRIEGVRSAQIEDGIVRLEFSQEKSREQFQQIAMSVGMTAAHMLQLHETNQVTVMITVNSVSRYEETYNTRGGVINKPAR